MIEGLLLPLAIIAVRFAVAAGLCVVALWMVS